MMRLFAVCVVVAALWGGGSGNLLAQAPQQPPQQQDEFVPIDQLPPEEQMPAAPMVVAAYAFIWVAFIAYVFTLVKRVRKVEDDVRRLERGGG
jgi:CcmD family protein